MTNDEEKLHKIVAKLDLNDCTSSGHQDALRQQMLDAFDAAGMAQRSRSVKLWRMRNRFMKRFAIPTAAAVVLAVGIIGALYWDSKQPHDGRHESGLAFAQVVEQIRNARNVTCTAYMYLPNGKLMGPPRKMMVLDDMRERDEFNGGIGISRLSPNKDECEYLHLDPKAKTAVKWKMKGIPPGHADRGKDELSLNWLGAMPQLISSGEHDVQRLGQKDMAGRRAEGFHLQKDGRGLTVWADAQTGLPIELQYDRFEDGGQLIIKDFQFNQAMDESLFSLTPPEGYTLVEQELDLTNLNESDLLNLLKVLADSQGGAFPTALDNATAAGLLGEYLRKSQEARMGRAMTESDEYDKVYLQQASVSGRGLGFLDQHKELKYFGAGLKLGQGEKVLLWYRPKDSQTYRVIYADLTVKDVAEKDLPPEPQTQPVRPAEATRPAEQ